MTPDQDTLDKAQWQLAEARRMVEFEINDPSNISESVRVTKLTLRLILAHVAALEGMTKELADDLEGELNAKYDRTLDHPSEKRRYDRDMASVTRARALLPDAAKPAETGQEYDTALRLLTDMEAQNMPIDKRAAIIAALMMRPNDADRAWAAGCALCSEKPS